MIASDEIKKLVDSIKKTCKTDDELIARLFYWIQTNIKYVSIKSSASSGWAGHPASETFANKFGDCTDVSILYSTMLQYAGIEAYPVIINTNDAGELLTEIPVPDGNHCIVEIRRGGAVFYIDPTSETYRFPYLREDDNDVKVVNYIKGEFGKTQLSRPEDNEKSSKLDITIDSAGNGKCSIINYYTGPYEAQVRAAWRRIKKQDTAKVMQNYISNLCSGAVFKNFDISDLFDLSKQLIMRIDFDASDMWERAGKMRILQLPAIEKKFDEIGLDERKYAIEYRALSSKINKITVTLPLKFKVKYYPENLEIDNEFVFYSGKYSVKNNILEFNEVFKIKKRVIPPEKYLEYKEGLRKINEFIQKRVFIEIP